MRPSTSAPSTSLTPTRPLPGSAPAPRSSLRGRWTRSASARRCASSAVGSTCDGDPHVTRLPAVTPTAFRRLAVIATALLAPIVMVHRADADWPRVTSPVRRELRALTTLLVATASAVLVLGTITTGTGPHAGDSTKRVPRFGLPLDRVTQLHADSALLLTGLVIATLFAVRLTDTTTVVRRRAAWLAAAVGVQVVLGYVQYFLNLPPSIVGMHVAGATALWCAAVWLALATAGRSDAGGAEVVDGDMVHLDHRPLAGQH